MSSDFFLNWQTTLLVSFGAFTVANLIGLSLFVYANTLTRSGIESIARETTTQVLDQFQVLANVSDACPIANISAPILPISQGFLEARAYSDLVVDSFDTYVGLYDNLVLSTVIFLATFWFGMVMHIVIGLVTRQTEEGRCSSVLIWINTFVGLGPISYGRELVLLITIIVVIGLLVATRLIGVVGVSVCPTVETLDEVLREASFLTTGNETNTFYESFRNNFVTCGEDNSPIGLLGTELNSTSDFFEEINNLGYACLSGNSTAYTTLSCTNNSLPCGVFNETTIPPGLEFVCQCKDFVEDLQDILLDCTTTAKLVREGFEGYFCKQVVEGITLGYISLILVLVATSLMLLVFTIINKVTSKIYSFNDFD